MKNKDLFNWLLIIGILYRFYFQFLVPSFYVDEISLGMNLKELNYLDLLKPMPRRQSAPPLFLLLNKLIVSSSPLPLWINFKILSFIASSSTMILFRKWVSKKKDEFIFIVPLLFFFFNPFVVYTSLTLKQYTFDLLGVLVLLYCHNQVKKHKFIPLVFFIWTLFSNAALFSFVAYSLYLFFSNYKKINISNLYVFCKTNCLLLCSPIVYIFYFLWFRKQTGFAELKSYMMDYWSESFLTFDKSIFQFAMNQIHEMGLIFYSQIGIVGLMVFAFTMLTLLYNIIVKKNIFLKSEILLLLLIYFIHFVFNIFKLYPLSDRLVFYNVILFILLLTSAIHFYAFKFKKALILIFSLIPILNFVFNFNYRENDIIALQKKLKQQEGKNIIITKKVNETIVEFTNFTDNYFDTKKEYSIIDNKDFKFSRRDVIVSRVHRKIKVNKTANEEEIIDQLLELKKIKLVDKVNGYNIYIANFSVN